MLKATFSKDINIIEAGCDEAGRGCLAGPVVAAAVILPQDFRHADLNDSKQMTAAKRARLRPIIEEKAIAWAVASCSPEEIDKHNILNASILAMHRALEALQTQPQLILVDGNKFKPYREVPYHCIVKGDATYRSIAAASVLAKTHRDAYMQAIAAEFPCYHWDKNKGYPTPQHRDAVIEYGRCKYHRKSFQINPALKLIF